MTDLSDLFAAERTRRNISREPDPAVRERFAFAGTLIALRQAAGLSQRDLADASGVPQPEISRIERALTVPTVIRAQRLLEPLGYRLAPTRVVGVEAHKRELALSR
ncbi:MAG: helix-turn-helix transcriptional regulator [Propionibacteriaceae bacterium]|nr:helix-turn-helix transcriptional regulator [Propionibacteriaceae bacterium]